MSLGVLPARLDLRAYQGDSYALEISLTQESSTPMNLQDMEVGFSLAMVRGAARMGVRFRVEEIRTP